MSLFFHSFMPLTTSLLSLNGCSDRKQTRIKRMWDASDTTEIRSWHTIREVQHELRIKASDSLSDTKTLHSFFFFNTGWQDFIAVENYHWVNLFICCHDNSEVNGTNTVFIWHFTYLIGQWSTLLVDVALWQSWAWSSILSHGAVSEHGRMIQVAILQSVLST